MEWYKKKSIHERINIKDACPMILGVEFHWLVQIFSFSEAIDLIYNKLKLEGFNV